MASNMGLIFLLIFPNLIVAEKTVDITSLVVTPDAFIIIGIVLASVFIAITLMGFIYFIVKFLKRKMSAPQYCIDDILNNKDSSEFNDTNNDIHPHVPHLYQIQPILTVSYIVSSVKQSLTDLGHSLVPFGWSEAQHVYNEQSPVNEKMDLPI